MSSPHDENVSRGVALLDEKAPGWEHRVDLKTLNLQSCTQCVVGQLFADPSTQGTYEEYEPLWSGYQELGVTSPRHYGFAIDWDLHWATTYGGLTKAWKRVIRIRRREAAASTGAAHAGGEGA